MRSKRNSIFQFVTICLFLWPQKIGAMTTEAQAQAPTISKQVLHKVMEDIRRCDKKTQYQYDEKTKTLYPPELNKLQGIRLYKLEGGIAIFHIDEVYMEMRSVFLTVRRNSVRHKWPSHAVGIEGDFQGVRRQFETLWQLRFKERLRPGPEVVYDGKYAEVEMQIDGKRRFLSIQKMPLDIYPYFSQTYIGCNHVDN